MKDHGRNSRHTEGGRWESRVPCCTSPWPGFPGRGEPQTGTCWELHVPSSGHRGPWSFSAPIPPGDGKRFSLFYNKVRIRSASALCPLRRGCEPRASYLHHYQPPPPSSPFFTSEYTCRVYLGAHLYDLILIVTAALFTLYSCRSRSSERLRGKPNVTEPFWGWGRGCGLRNLLWNCS